MSETYKSFEDVEVVCPYYNGIADRGRVLRCEGFFEESVLSSTFRTPEARKRHMTNYCNTFGCERCGLYRLLDEKYP